MAMAKVEVSQNPQGYFRPLLTASLHISSRPKRITWSSLRSREMCSTSSQRNSTVTRPSVRHNSNTCSNLPHHSRFHIFIGFCLEGFSCHCNINFMHAGTSFVLYPVLYLAPKTATMYLLTERINDWTPQSSKNNSDSIHSANCCMVQLVISCEMVKRGESRPMGFPWCWREGPRQQVLISWLFMLETHSGTVESQVQCRRSSTLITLY